MLEPYSDDPKNTGLMVTPQEAIYAWAKKATDGDRQSYTNCRRMASTILGCRPGCGSLEILQRARSRNHNTVSWIEVFGRSGQDLARAFALHAVSVYRTARRGRAHRATWDLIAMGRK